MKKEICAVLFSPRNSSQVAWSFLIFAVCFVPSSLDLFPYSTGGDSQFPTLLLVQANSVLNLNYYKRHRFTAGGLEQDVEGEDVTYSCRRLHVHSILNI